MEDDSEGDDSFTQAMLLSAYLQALRAHSEEGGDAPTRTLHGVGSLWGGEDDPEKPSKRSFALKFQPGKVLALSKKNPLVHRWITSQAAQHVKDSLKAHFHTGQLAVGVGGALGGIAGAAGFTPNAGSAIGQAGVNIAAGLNRTGALHPLGLATGIALGGLAAYHLAKNQGGQRPVTTAKYWNQHHAGLVGAVSEAHGLHKSVVAHALAHHAVQYSHHDAHIAARHARGDFLEGLAHHRHLERVDAAGKERDKREVASL